MRFKLKK